MAILCGVYIKFITSCTNNAVSSEVWENIHSNHSTKSDIEHKKFGGLETNRKCMNIIIVQKCV